MKYANLYNLLALCSASVTMGHAIEDTESDFGEGQRALVVGVDVDETGTCPCVIFDATTFEDYNKSVAKPVYYDASGSPSLTSFEAGCYKAIDSLFVDQDADFVPVPDAEHLRVICDYVIKENLENAALPVIMLNLASKQLAKTMPVPVYSINRGISAPLSVGDTIMTTENRYCPYSGKELPAMSIAQIAGDEEDGFYLKSPDDKALAEWNKGISMSFADDVFRPADKLTLQRASDVLADSRSRFCIDDPDINNVIVCDTSVRHLIYACGAERFDRLVNLAAASAASELENPPSQPFRLNHKALPLIL